MWSGSHPFLLERVKAIGKEMDATIQRRAGGGGGRGLRRYMLEVGDDPAAAMLQRWCRGPTCAPT